MASKRALNEIASREAGFVRNCRTAQQINRKIIVVITTCFDQSLQQASHRTKSKRELATSGRAFEALQLMTSKARGARFAKSSLRHLHAERNRSWLPGGRSQAASSQAASSSCLPRPTCNIGDRTSANKQTKHNHLTAMPQM